MTTRMMDTSDFNRATQRVAALGYSSVTAYVTKHLGPVDRRQVRSFVSTLSRGLNRRSSMTDAARLFGVPPTFWLEDDPVRLAAAMTLPEPNAPVA